MSPYTAQSGKNDQQNSAPGSPFLLAASPSGWLFPLLIRIAVKKEALVNKRIGDGRAVAATDARTAQACIPLAA